MVRYSSSVIVVLVLILTGVLSGQVDTTLTITSDGKVGIGTTDPIDNLEVQGSFTVDGAGGLGVFRIRQNDSLRWTFLTAPWTGDNDLWLRNEGTGDLMAFDKETNRVGIGTTEPIDKLEVQGSFAVDGAGGLGVFRIRQNDSLRWTFLTAPWIGDNDLRLRNEGVGVDVMVFDKTTSNVGIQTNDPMGTLDVNGAIYQRGSELHADYVFEDTYQLESIDEHSAFMWQNKHLKAIPKAKRDKNGREIVEVGAHRKGIVEELEKAHIYIDQLHNRLKTLEEKLDKLANKQDK